MPPVKGETARTVKSETAVDKDRRLFAFIFIDILQLMRR